MVGVALVLGLAAGCAHAPGRFDAAKRPTCLVLSVGGPDGVAHFGALAAVRDARLPVAAVVGNSFGSVAGALYAHAPLQDTRARFEALVSAYANETKREARRRGLAVGLLFGAAAAVLSDGEPATTVFAGGGGYLLGAATIDRVDLERLIRVMDRVFEGARIEALSVPFVTFHQRPRGTGLDLVAVRDGSLAAAVGASVSNPLVFPGIAVAEGERLDPGADRAAAVPVEDACRLFPGTNVLAINVTGKPAFHSAAMTCPLLEVRVPPVGLSIEDALAGGALYREAVENGYRETARRLGESSREVSFRP